MNYNLREDYWGTSGAGALIFCESSKRFLLPLRSKEVEEPGTWGVWGGAMDRHETPEEAVIREVWEETSMRITERSLTPLYVFKDGSFKYYNFLVIVSSEFEPYLDWETASAQWFKLEEFPDNLHFGLKALLKDEKSIEIICSYLLR